MGIKRNHSGIKSGESMTEDETIIWARQAIIASKSTMRDAIDKRVCGPQDHVI